MGGASSFGGFFGGIGLVVVGLGVGVSSLGSGDLLSSWGSVGATVSATSDGSFFIFLGGGGFGNFFVPGDTLPSALAAVSTVSWSSSIFIELSVLGFGLRGTVGWWPFLAVDGGEFEGEGISGRVLRCSGGVLGGLS